MGGFKFFDDNGPRTLGPQELQSLTRKGEIDFPDITEREIEDRSKGDALSKGLVLIQTSWFILQCIARRIEHLPITELELVTLAFAALNFITYALWWNKPLNVQCPFRVLKKQRKDESEESKGVAENSSQSSDDDESREDSGGWGAIAVVRKILEAISKATCAIVHTIRDAIERSVKYIRQHRWWTLWDGVKVAATYGIVAPIAAFTSMGLRSNDVGTMFYAGDSGQSVVNWHCGRGHRHHLRRHSHCVAWSFQFPSHAEQLLWRIASLSITCVPMVMVFLGLAFRQVGTGWLLLLTHVLTIPVFIGGMGFPVLYVLSRVALLVIALMSLRSLPPGAYETVHWTTFIPHV
jgi:hypothetical protein